MIQDNIYIYIILYILYISYVLLQHFLFPDVRLVAAGSSQARDDPNEGLNFGDMHFGRQLTKAIHPDLWLR